MAGETTGDDTRQLHWESAILNVGELLKETSNDISVGDNTVGGGIPHKRKAPDRAMGKSEEMQSSLTWQTVKQGNKSLNTGVREPKHALWPGGDVELRPAVREAKRAVIQVLNSDVKLNTGVKESKYAIQTRSDVELLDDGFNWRKKGIKAVKNSPHPRSYYCCIYPKCHAKKMVERKVDDPGLVITTYKGLHTHFSSASAAALNANFLTPFENSSTSCQTHPSSASSAALNANLSTIFENSSTSCQAHPSPVSAAALNANSSTPSEYSSTSCQAHPLPNLESSQFDMLEPLDRTKSLLRMWNTYIQSDKFDEFCSARGVSDVDKTEINRGRLTAALFPEAFYCHLTTLLASKAPTTLLASRAPRPNLPQLFKEAADLVVKNLPYTTDNSGGGESQAFQFFDFRHREPVNVDVIFSLGGLVAVCQKFPGPKVGDSTGVCQDPETNASTEYCIVQHNLTGSYLCRRVVKSELNEDKLIQNATGILGLEITSDDMHVENIRDDGSYYSGTLKDFSYKFVMDKNGDLEATDKQCATRLFGHLKGAEFLTGKEYGLKCSPLLAIALSIATQSGKLTLKWNEMQGHMEIENSKQLEGENIKWQVLYTNKINELGLAIEWGMEQMMAVDQLANSQVVGSSSHSHDLQALSSVFGNAVQQKRTIGLQLSFPGGVGVGGNIEVFSSKGKALAKEAHLQIMERLWREESKFVEVLNVDAKHAHVKNDLLQGRLPDCSENYLVVWDDAKNGHVSVYWVTKDGKLEWITDVLLPGGKEDNNVLKGRLKGLRMEVKRDGSNFVSTNACKSTSSLISRFKQKNFRTLMIV